MADQLFKKKRGKKLKRKEAIKEMAPYRYLIVCEGKKTETNYFEGIKKRINQKYGNKLVVKQVKADRIEVDGTGRNTQNLVRYAIDKRRSAEIPYGHVWCVFDKDLFSDEQFNTAINEAEKNGLQVAWSNEAIELWFLLHFEYLNTGIPRNQYEEKLGQYFTAMGINNGKYEKNLVDIFDILFEYGDVDRAIKNAKRLKALFDKAEAPSKR